MTRSDQPVCTRHDSMAPESAERFSSVLDVPRAFRPGDEVPLLWHWAYFIDAVPQSELGPDGHARRNDASMGQLPRRMAASGSVRRLGSLLLGRPATRISYLEDITEKRGHSGPLAFANWRHTIEQDGRTLVEESQTIVYRSAPSEVMLNNTPSQQGRQRTPVMEPLQGPLRVINFDSALLFRFSAVTWNAHRIHYDLPYATITEGYPGLVVHGPLLAALVSLEASRELGDLEEVEFRMRAPIFLGDDVWIFGAASPSGTFSAEARRADGGIAMSLVAHARK